MKFGLSSPSTPVPDDDVRIGGAMVGYVTAGAWSPFLEHGIGYVRMLEHGDWEGAHVTVGNADAPGELVALPFYDPDRSISRGVSTERPEP